MDALSGPNGVRIREVPTYHTVDWEIFTRKNIRLLNFRFVLFSSLRHTGSVALFLLFNVDKYSCFSFSSS